jgi:hypothetical protein
MPTSLLVPARADWQQSAPPDLVSKRVMYHDKNMNNIERIADFIRRFPGRDDDEISVALEIEPRQVVNQVCRRLAKAGQVERRPNPTGKLGNYPLGSSGPNHPTPFSETKSAAVDEAADATKEWFWEGNVTDALAKYLTEQGWQILSQADTKTKARGLDLHAKYGNKEILVEVKGYPSRSYRDRGRAGQLKPTSPTLQAQHWYSHALLKAMRLHSAHPSAIVAVAFPDFPRYRTLFSETERALCQLGIAVLFVLETGQVETVGL